MLFAAGGGSYGRPSMHDFYLQQSSGRFTWTGQVSNWVQVNGAESAFGANARKTGAGGDNANGVVYRVVQATLEGLAASGNYGGVGLASAGVCDSYEFGGGGKIKQTEWYLQHFFLLAAGGGGKKGGGAPG